MHCIKHENEKMKEQHIFILFIQKRGRSLQISKIVKQIQTNVIKNDGKKKVKYSKSGSWGYGKSRFSLITVVGVK
jgi:hypothetical protein